MCGNSLETAIQLYFDDPTLGNHQQPPSSNNDNNNNNKNNNNNNMSNGNSANDLGFDLDAIDDFDIPKDYSEPDVRKADTSKKMNLMSGYGDGGYGGGMMGGRGYGGGRAETYRHIAPPTQPHWTASAAGLASIPSSKSATLSTMFSSPTKIIFPGEFPAAKLAAKEEKRFIIVNISAESAFASHALNRDVFNDSWVQELITSSFIFCQYQDDSPEGVVYKNLYKVTEIPHISIIDPRTGVCMWRYEGWTMEDTPSRQTVTKEKFVEVLNDFCERYNYESGPKAPGNGRLGCIGSTGSIPAMNANVSRSSNDGEGGGVDLSSYAASSSSSSSSS